MKKSIFILLLTCMLLGTLFAQTPTTLPYTQKIGFGSCANQNKPQPILLTADSLNPDMFIYLGDNIYGDSPFMFVLKAKYRKLSKRPEFQKLKEGRTLLATWDDHDYGKNDAGEDYKQQRKSKKIFLKFWGEPQNSARWQRRGIYTAYMYQTVGKRKVQIILLDNRTFRSPLEPADLSNGHDKNDYGITSNIQKTMLGEKQWRWLEAQLTQPADVRIICTSTQFCVDYNGYEAWANFPLEQARMFQIIEKTHAQGVIFISGDVHYAELNALKPDSMYTLYDMTSSGITETWSHVEPSDYRLGKAYQPNNFGMIAFEETPNKKDLWIKMGIFNVKGEKVIEKNVLLSSLVFP